jgi:signal transduction histidine kinase
MNRLWVRLTLAFGLVAVAAVVIVATLADRQTSTRFRQFVVHDEMLNSTLLADLSDYYAHNGSWEGVESVIDAVSAPAGMGRGMMGRGRTMRRGMPGLVLADAGGRVVYDEVGRHPAPMLSSQERAAALPIESEGQAVGYILAAMAASVDLTPAAQDFLSQLNRSLLQAGLIAGTLGVLLGLAIARGIAAPLSRLRAAAQRISRGELDQRVPVEGAVETADLARAFNDMVAALQRAETVRRNMVADIAHELRTPLTVIQGNLKAILDDVYPLEKAEVAAVYDETVILSRLVNDLRDLTQAEAGQLTLEVGTTEIRPIAEQAVGLFEELARDKGIRLSSTVPADLPVVMADADRVRQVIHNLLANALQHTPEGGEVRVSAERLESAAGGVQVSVSDTGPGIAAQDVAFVFDRFWRADKSRAREYGGAGLGLAIARQLVEAQGGEIGVTSDVGAGSRFWFSLPTSLEFES